MSKLAAMDPNLLINPNSNASRLGKVPLASILQRLPGLLQIIFIPFCFLGPVYAPATFGFYFVFLHLSFAYNATRSMVASRIAYKRAKEHSTTNWAEKYCQEIGVQSINDTRHDLPFDSIKHVIIIPQYKEELGTMYDTLDVLASHPQALTHYKICLAMEESEKGATQKAHGLIKKYLNQFYDITMTLHPSGRPGEIRGKSSNVAWAAKEMVRQAGGPRVEDIITVMDADTCFAADYFAALSYHYAVGTPKQRALMFFAPPTVFDRNAHKVPFLVRVADMQWSMGVISNMYNGSPFTPPCSAYSIPMKLAAAVGLWDVDPNSIGEDFHMYIKCFFSTHGEVIIKPIYSPASCCNIEGTNSNSRNVIARLGGNFLSGIYARSVQAKRHLWGALDLGYTIRRAIFGLFAPTFDAPNNLLQRIPFMSEHSRFDFHRLATRLIPFTYRVLECHIFVGQVLLMMIICKNFIPPEDGSNWLWDLLSGGNAVHPYVHLALASGNYITQAAGLVFIGAVIYYEKYQYWSGVKRWELAFCEELHPGTGCGVQPLGIRSRLKAVRHWFNMVEWVFIPVVGLVFMVIPQVYVHLCQIYTSSLTYVVAQKPKHEIRKEMTEIYEEVVLVEPVRGISVASSPVSAASATSSPPSKLRPGSLVVKEDIGARGDSGFYEFDGAGLPQSDFHPGMWAIKETIGHHLPNSPSQDSVETLANLAN